MCVPKSTQMLGDGGFARRWIHLKFCLLSSTQSGVLFISPFWLVWSLLWSFINILIPSFLQIQRGWTSVLLPHLRLVTFTQFDLAKETWEEMVTHSSFPQLWSPRKPCRDGIYTSQLCQWVGDLYCGWRTKCLDQWDFGDVYYWSRSWPILTSLGRIERGVFLVGENGF